MLTKSYILFKRNVLGSRTFCNKFCENRLVGFGILKTFKKGCLWGPPFWKPRHMTKFKNSLFTTVGCFFYFLKVNIQYRDALYWQVFASKWLLLHIFSCEVMTSFTHSLILDLDGCGRVVRRCFVSYITGASQLILDYSWARPAILEAGKDRGECFYFLCFFTFIPVPLSSLSLSFISSTISSISYLLFSGWRHKMTHKGCVVKPQHNQSIWTQTNKILKLL